MEYMEKFKNVVISVKDGVSAVYNEDTKLLVKAMSKFAYAHKEDYDLEEDDFE